MLSAADIAHGYLVIIDLRGIVGERVAADGKFIAIEYQLLLGEDVADIYLHIFVPRLLDFGHTASHRAALHQYLEDLRTFRSHTLSQSLFYLYDVAQGFHLLAQLAVLPQHDVPVLDQKFVALQQLLDNLPQRGDYVLISGLRFVPLLVQTQQCSLQSL